MQPIHYADSFNKTLQCNALIEQSVYNQIFALWVTEVWVTQGSTVHVTTKHCVTHLGFFI